MALSDNASGCDDIAPAFFGVRVLALSDLIVEQGGAMLLSRGLKTNARSVSLILALEEKGPMSLTELARALGQPHQVTAQRLAYAQGARLVRKRPDPDDARRNILSLTAAGRREAAALHGVLREAAGAFVALFREVECDLLAGTERALAALQARPLAARMAGAKDGAAAAG